MNVVRFSPGESRERDGHNAWLLPIVTDILRMMSAAKPVASAAPRGRRFAPKVLAQEGVFKRGHNQSLAVLRDADDKLVDAEFQDPVQELPPE